MIVVLDASGAAEIASKTEAGIEFINIMMRAERVLAPDIYMAEINNYAWKIGRKDKSRADVCIEVADECIQYIDEYVSSFELWKEALRMAQTEDHPAYDMLYAVIARRHDAMLLTMDKKLFSICEKLSIKCKNMELVRELSNNT